MQVNYICSGLFVLREVCCIDVFVTRMKCKLGEDTQLLFTHLDAGALVWDTRTPFLACPTQVLQWILGVSLCGKLYQKR
ncbi:hypothetical protein AB205_0136670 [Aquarana catesbeiana]|uniref:Uncharacterized protein n=1 Tax=Aquarana catesbeiana TaxID=8400 RepID=A0A2G9QB59_AQUCT|nr:hypothetical protein AB205_0136670 [Aquarana catesbeiana]